MSERLLTILQKLKTKHYECDDCYYSCPKCEEGCCNEFVGDECTCGADEQNALVDEAISIVDKLTAELAEWRADAERLAKRHVERKKSDKQMYCIHCDGFPHMTDYRKIVHDADCPITLHRQLVEKYKESK